jgi:putative ABC transport system ATP-binding protein
MALKPFVMIRKLWKTYQMGNTRVDALAGVDLDIPRKSLTVVMGPSGSGKSTLLYLLGGLDRASSGSIEVDGQKLEEMDENALALFRRNTVGFIFQSFNLISSMDSIENVAFPMRFAGIGSSERRKHALELLTRVGLEQRARHKPTELSGGQQQRVAIARALVNDPSLILADEPTGNLDRASGYSIMQVLSDLHKSGRTVLVVTHDPRMQHFATHTVFLLDGKTVSKSEYEEADLQSIQAIPQE